MSVMGQLENNIFCLLIWRTCWYCDILDATPIFVNFFQELARGSVSDCHSGHVKVQVQMALLFYVVFCCFTQYFLFDLTALEKC